MVDPVATQTVGVDFHHHTQSTHHQLGVRLAHILGSELTRLRADLAFASSTGISVQATYDSAEFLRAQQTTLLGHHSVSLMPQSSVHAELLRHATENLWCEESDFDHGSSGIREKSPDDNHPGSHSHEESHEDGHNIGNPFSMDVEELLALRDVLENSVRKFLQCLTESGYSGTPILSVFPAAHWLEKFAPAHLRNDTTPSASSIDMLILCLGFDGYLLADRQVWGLVYRQNECVGKVRGQWSLDAQDVDNCWTVRVAQSHSSVSESTCNCSGPMHKDNDIKGLRIKTANDVEEPFCWSVTLYDWVWQ